MNETLAMLLNRRTVRSFQDKEIAPEDKRIIQEATLRAPTGGNMSPFSVIDVTDATIKASLSDICDHQPMIAGAPMVWVFVADWQKWYDWFKGDKCAEKSGRPLRAPALGDLDIAVQDALIAAETSVIAAEALGIGSCYVGDVIENGEKLADLLRLPRFAFPACMLIYGYKKEAKTGIPLLPRPPVEDMFMQDTYHRRSLDEIRKAYKEHEAHDRLTGRLPYEGKGSTADELYRRKYTSDFMKEMTRSLAWWLQRWNDGNQTVQD